MKKYLYFLIVIYCTTALYAYSDSDLDGVEDAYDKCPNTPLSDLVDTTGCSIESLISPHHYDILIGLAYANSDYQTLNQTDTLSTSLQADYYYKDFSLQFNTAYFTTSGDGYSDNGFYDTSLGASYGWTQNDVILRVGVGVILPTYDNTLSNNKSDLFGSVNLSYSYEKFNFFGGYSYTLIRDDDYSDANISVAYQNTNAYSIGLGYYFNYKLYTSATFNSSKSIYVGVEDVQTATLYGYYSIDEHYFGTLSYAYGISESASSNYIALRVGYYF